MRSLLLVVLLISCSGPSVSVELTDPVTQCEVLRTGVMSYIQRCTPSDYVCVPPVLLRPCSTAVAVNSLKYKSCYEYLHYPRLCSSIMDGCDWENIITYNEKVLSNFMSPVEKCESLNYSTLKCEINRPGYKELVCVRPDRLHPCSRAIWISDRWDECMQSLEITPTDVCPCKDKDLVGFE